jgi:hypothetical protein
VPHGRNAAAHPHLTYSEGWIVALAAVFFEVDGTLVKDNRGQQI